MTPVESRGWWGLRSDPGAPRCLECGAGQWKCNLGWGPMGERCPGRAKRRRRPNELLKRTK